MNKIIDELTSIIKHKKFEQKYLIKYKVDYELSSMKYRQICKICENLVKEDLPYDCLCKPSYCVKNEYDFKIIQLYEELQENIEQNNYG